MDSVGRCFIIVILLFAGRLYAQPIIVWDRLLTHPNSMVPDLLKRALQVTADEYGPFQIVPSERMEQGRVIKKLAVQGNVQVAVFAPNKYREEIAIPVRIPVTGSLLSYRICLIRRADQADFTFISSLDDLINSKLMIGQHQDWPDTEIMEANGLTVWKGKKYDLLFNQLEAGRFDCFSRGANEIVQEHYAHSYKGLEIEKSLIIYYPLPLYYFVNKADPELAVRLEKGLNLLKENGEYEAIFKAKFSQTLKRLAIKDRTIIKLENPLLTEPTKAQMREDTAAFNKLVSDASL
ncbi:substrate-binding periplasmic protein [Psychromonas aquimarina]|uniref:substrate-binding periplasmic protein n=1 Tax=Psychromonas aquimarina TaxID=444919 RepID=UPI0003FF437B|nr:transporter substrate-binding domain-containing protein [Psychromonas aquimarina]